MNTPARDLRPRWRPRNRVLLNLRLGRRHVQMWLWGARIIPSEDGRNFWALHEIFFWTLRR